MSYVTNPHAPKARGDAVRLVKLHGWSQSKVARHMGVSQSAVSKWCSRAPSDLRQNIPTIPSRPKSSPNALDPEIIKRIIDLRKKHKRCAPVIHQYLLNEDVAVSLSSVERTLRRRYSMSVSLSTFCNFINPPLSSKVKGNTPFSLSALTR